ncbi:hypothetical protein COCOBI_07-0030 [Coccomyxa sp. Obi]|nr:hypothetical protein COCOBI_07-0030 [Coccomyxa sp. Obi]
MCRPLQPLVILAKTGIARLLWDGWRLNDSNRRRSEGRGPRVDASSSLALSDEVSGALVGDDLKVVGSTGVEEVDGRRRPVSEDDGPLLLSHGDVLCVVVPVIAEGMELSLEFEGDGEYEGIVGGRVMVPGSEESEGLVTEESDDSDI